MLPNAYEFSWDPYRVVFVAFFLGAACLLVGYMAAAAWRSWRDVSTGHAAQVRWHDDFADLPQERRACRHSMDGAQPARTCEHAFDCAQCEHHAAAVPTELDEEVRVHGLVVHPDLAYHRGHTWVRSDDEGYVTVGLSPLAQRILPGGHELRLPEPGTWLHRSDVAFALHDSSVRILTPVEGRVLGVGHEEGVPVLRMEVERPPSAYPELLRGVEAVQWMESELRQLQTRLLGSDAAAAWADGGAVVDDLPRSVPDADWTSVREEFFLDV